ncbi:MAG: succinate dehydrogenase [Myxococcota bacterium]
MADAATVDTSSSKVDRSFLWRRLHSLTGVLPVGGFLVFHLYENLAALKGPAAYDAMVTQVNSMLPKPYFMGLELGGVLLPLLFHSLYGIYIASTGQPNVGRYAYGSNWAYWAQRFSGYVAFIYILVHVGVLRFFVTLGGNHLASGGGELVTYNDVAAHLGNPRYLFVDTMLAGNHIFALYLLGTLLTIYHFTNGLNGFAWTWGLAVGRKAQARVRLATWALFAALSVATLNILFTMRLSA